MTVLVSVVESGILVYVLRMLSGGLLVPLCVSILIECIFINYCCTVLMSGV